MKQIYAVAYYAEKISYGSVTTGYSVGIVRARSEAEAIGMTVEMAKERCPLAECWQSHQASVNLVPQEWIDEQAT